MNRIEEFRFKAFREDVLKCEGISTENLWVLMNRHTQGNIGRKFFGGQKGRLF